MEDQERAELLSRRDGDGGTSAAWRGGPDTEAQEASFVASSRRALEEAFETGSAALASMAGQRERLKARAFCACPRCLACIRAVMECCCMPKHALLPRGEY